jgi:hypothetical protein
MGKSKDYPREEKSAEVRKLKDHIRHQDKEIARLKSELRTYDRAFQKNLVFLKEKTKDLNLEDLLKGAEEELTLKQIKDDKKDRFSEIQRKWKCHHCDDGILRLIIVPGIESNRYFRKCSMCVHRTPVKEYTEDVEGIQ